MQNPFIRLKHYKPDLLDARENHATECLAAALVLSPKAAREFVRFLFADALPFTLDDTSTIDVTTQEWTDEHGCIDLVLRCSLKFTIAVEVKVGSPEDCPHHKRQLKEYAAWLRTQRNGFLFTLVMKPDPKFELPKHVKNRLEWRKLHQRFQAFAEKSFKAELVDANVVSHLCDYLEREGIVVTYTTKDLLAYVPGGKGEKALDSIFNQLAGLLQKEGFTSTIEKKRDKWPVLHIEHSEWEKIFGEGDNKKISLWFTLPGIWGATRHDFALEIELWHRGHRNDWAFTKPQLGAWLRNVQTHQFKCNAFLRDWDHAKENAQPEDISTRPYRIVAVPIKEVSLLAQDNPQPEAVLIELLYKEVQQCAEIIGALESKQTSPRR